ncbi:MAG: type II toxin-antitoxin system HicA family toxin [Candidatus Zhuqueibacterota bacterium]
MSPGLPILNSRDVIKVVKQLGFKFDRQSGSHAVYIHPEKKFRVVIPIHSGKDIKPKTLKGIISDIGVTLEEFKELL